MAISRAIDEARQRWNERLLRARPFRRCTRCVLPETVPFLDLDEVGVCRHCRSPHARKPVDPAPLAELAARLRASGKRPDSIVALSGGRDSCYVLHHVCRVLKLQPVAFCYDWGFLTETGARNQERLCRTLDVERVNLADQIQRNRRNMRVNLRALLERPHPGLVPLLMAGDKPFFRHARDIKARLGLDTIFFGMHDLEAEDFKQAFAGARTSSRDPSKHHYGVHPLQKVVITLFYGLQFLLNPRLLNDTIPDTFRAYLDIYFLPHDYFFNLFTGVVWDEDEVESTLAREYGWEREPGSPTSWRTGDATQGLISWLYLAWTGFTENDFLRSNQVRAGVLSREKALARVEAENVPRYDSIADLCRLIDVDFEWLVQKVEAPRLMRSWLCV